MRRATRTALGNGHLRAALLHQRSGVMHARISLRAGSQNWK
jgi:hypothetical protein